ncbi:Ig-like domain-containing protein [Citrobacter sedlakii]|uniref:Ig-like domain-containing protein n=2 Tax=Citrobacter sedlakii TaxID=67826 RepID=UPI0020BF5FBC|nr:Ig-like domain-containing protein [Citrobacter sedlakii]MCK8144024.1 Ig-like domain-containing protein [Citrobacter sedlakii]
MNTLKTANIINRHTAKKTVLSGEGNLSVAVSGASVIEILGSAQDVARYVRQGNDLLIYMKDGSVIRCSGYFTEDPELKLHSELVFNDETGLTHVTFDDVGNVASLDAVELTAHATPIDSIEPLMAEAASEENDFPWAWLAGAALGGGAIGALLANDDGGETKTVTVTETETVDNTKNTPTYMVTDNQGDKQGGLTANATTDDNTPTFSGTGHPGATIQIKDSNGNTIASTMVDANGVWTVLLPTQTDGVHTWSVVQINGGESTSAGKITVNVDTTQATLTLATTANDNVINASEQSAGFTLSGSSSHLAQGTQLTVTLNGKSYLTRVDANGEWQINVPAADAAALADGSWTVSVSGQNAAGNTVTGTQVIAVDTQAPLLSMDSIAVDQILNAVEHNASLALSGKTTAEAGQTVTLTLNGQTYTALVTNEGTWALTVDAADVQALANGDHSLTVSVSDKAGNAADFSDQLTVDTTAPILTVNPVAGDNILNDDEQDVAQLISGMANGAAPGDVVTVQFGDQTFTGVVQADGSWSVGVPASLFNSMSNGQHTITVTVTDAAGNTSTATHDVTLNSLAVGITVDTISQDNVLNAQESMQPLTLSGASTLTDGSTLTVMLNNIAYTATVNGGVWSVQVPVSDVLNLANTLYHVTVSGTDATGNSGTTSASFLVDTALPQVVINHFATDNLVNHAETQSDQILSGRVIHAAAGDTVTVQVGGKSYSATVENDLSWKVTIPANDLQHFGDGDLTFTASVTNSHGNTGTGDHDISINASLPGLRINTLSGDDIVNAIEHHQDLVVSGSSSHLAAGTLVTVSINNVNYQAVVSSNGGWQIGVPASDLQNWNAGQLTVTASAQDGWGNPVSVDHPVELDLDPVAITINTVAADDLINAAEKGADLLLSGQTQGVEAGQTVVVKFADQTFTAQVQADGSWRVTVPSSAMDLLTDSREQIGVSVTNVSGNTASASHTVTLDSHAPVITISTIAADDILNATEAQADLLIGGTTTAPAGQTVTVTIGGTGYTTQVQANGSWSVTVPAADVPALSSGAVTATVSDAAGNTGSASHALTVDTAAPVVTINTVATDDIINSAEHGQTQMVSGAVSGAAAGDAVVVTINNKTYTTVVDAAGNWSVGVPAADITALNDGTTTVSVTVTSAAGNSGSATHDVTVNTAAPAITINSVTTDDVINAAEQGADLTLSGATTNVEAGQNVTVLFNGKSYMVTVNSTGNWTLVVPAADLATLTDGSARVEASVSNAAGNSASATHDYSVDTGAPLIAISTIAADDILNATEAQADLVISGTTTAPAGQTVTVTIGGTGYTTQVQANGSWSVTVPAADVPALSSGAVTATVSDAAGNTGSASHTLTVDTAAPVVTINTVATDDIINSAEHGQTQMVSGTVSGAAAGDAVVVTINNKTYTTVVDASGNWSVGVPAADITALNDGTTTVSVTVTSAAGNSGTATHDVNVNTAAPVVTINSVTADDVINAAEQGADLTLSGATTNVEAGQNVTVTFGGKTYTASVDSNGAWTLVVPAAELATLTDGSARVEASVSNTAGNSASATRDYGIDTDAPVIAISTIAADDILNATEAQADLLIGGTTTAPAGQTVTVTIGSNSYTTQVQANGSWSVTVPAADVASITTGAVTASVADAAGNTGSASHTLTVDTAAPVVTINTVATDDIINSAEHGQTQLVSGAVSGAAAGDAVVVTINNKTYTTVVDASGNWSVGVPAADITALNDGTTTVSVTVTSAAGNSGSATHDVTVNTAAPVVTINSVTADDVINAAEQGADLTLSGATTNVEAGQNVTVTFGGKTYTASVDSNGAWTLVVPAADLATLSDGSARVEASVSNAAGNSASATHDYSVDTGAPVIAISTIAADDILNATEAQADLLIGGTTTAPAGQTVTVTIGGTGYTTQVQANGSWSVTVPAADVASLASGTVTASVADAAGNTGSASHTLTVDTAAPVVTINTVATDDIINSAEHGQTQLVSGAVSGAVAGDAVVVTINNKTYTTVVDASGNWSIGVPAADITALNDGTTTVSVTVTSAAGNSGTATHDVTVNTAAPVVTINNVTTDDVINAAEQGADLTLSGTTTNVEAGQNVTVTFGGKTYTASVDTSGHWTLVVPAAELAGLTDGSARVEARVSNAAGNSASATHDYSIDTDAPVIAISTIAADDILNATEAQADLLIGGTTTAPAGQTVTVTIGGTGYTTQVQANGSWSVTVPAADVASITTGAVTVSVADAAGNTGSASHTLTVDTAAPVVTINTVATDDIINSAEHGQTQMVSGAVSGAAAGDAVVVTINSRTYTTVVDASGNWSIGVPAADITALNDGTTTVSVTVTSAAGNSGTATHDVNVNTAAPVVTINNVTADDVINAAEQGADLTLSGATTNVEAGQNVTVNFGGKTYTTSVDSNGAWTLVVPAADLSTLTDGSARVAASVSNTAGNSASATHDYSVDTDAPVIAISTIAADDILNATEAQADLLIGGTTTAPAGQTVTVTIGGTSYTTQVEANGSWSVTVPAADVASITTGAVTASVADAAGNTGSASHTLTVDTAAPVVTINTVATDDIINSAEHGQTQMVSGAVTGAAAGDAVVVTINNKTYTTVVDASGNWSVGVPAADITALNDGTTTVSVTVTSAAGNSGSATHDVNVNTAAPVVTINSVTDDDVINAAEQGADLTLSGATTNVEAGQNVTVTFGGKTYTASVDSNGAWTLVVPAAELAGLTDGSARVEASVSNVAGNSASATRDYSIDTDAPVIAISTIAADDILNATEAQADLLICGTTTAPAGQTVTVTIGGTGYTTQVQANGSWSVTVPAADVASLASGTVTASVADAAGNTGSASHTLTVDTAAPVVTINTVATDDIINSAEHGQTQMVSGAVSGAAAGDAVVVTINNKTYTTVVDAAGNWSVGVPAADITALNDGTTTVSVTVTSAAGNSGSATHDVTVNTAAPVVTINSVTADDVINAAEQGADLTLSGATTNVEAGQNVTVLFNGKSYMVTINSTGNWTLVVPAADLATLTDGSARVEASVSNAAGNSASATHDYSVDTGAPVIAISTISADDVLNAAEQQQPLTVQGNTSAEAGQTVTVTLNGANYTAQVQANGTWSVTVPATDLAGLSDGPLTVSAVVSDKAGNESQAAHNLTVDASAPVITVNTVAGDNIINSGEQRAGQTFSGTTTAEPGQTVTLTFNGHTYQTTVDTSGNWSLFVPAGDFTGLADGNYVISVTVNDAAGNAGNVTHNVILNGDVPTIAIDAISTDDVINAAEQGAPLTLSGTTDAPAGQTVTITLNGNRYTAVVDSNGQWSCVVSSVDVAALADGTAYTVNAQVSNTIGNSASADRVMNVDLTAPAQIINIDAVQGDSGLSGSDFITNSNLVVLDGSLSASLASGETAQISLDGGTTWIDLLVNGTQWSYADGRSLADGGYLYIVRVIDAAGNVGSVDSQSVRVDTTPPAVTLISVDAITQDTGLSTSDYITHDNQISLQGSLNAALASDEHVQISLDGGNTWTDVSVSGLSWSFADGRTLADGDYIYQLRVIDQAGNVSATTSQTVTVDTLVPDATKTIVFDSITDDSGLSSSDFITKDTSLSLQGSLGATLAPGEIVQISLDGGATWQNVTVIGNSWSFADGRTLGEGVHDYWVRVIDTAGNIGATAHQQVSVDLTPPDSAITVSIDSISTDTGYSSSDFLTNDTSLTLSGSLGAPLAAGDRVQISVDNGLTWHDVVTNGNSWHYVDSRTLPEGDQAYQVRVVDVAGNVGATTNQVVTVDLTASTNAANIHSYTDDVASSRGEFAAGTTTDDRMPVLNGTLTTGLLTGEMVRIYRADGTLVGEADVNGTDWTLQLNEPLVDGEKGEFYAVVVDAAGNEGAQSPVFDFTVDLKMYADTQNTLDTTPIITGRVDFEILPGEYVEVTINNVVYSSRNGAVVIDPKNSTWYVQLPDSDALALGTYDVKAALFKADGTEITHDDTTGELTVSPTPSITFTSSAASSEDTGTALTLGEDGTWRILSNSTVFTQNATDSTTLGSFDSVAISGPDRQQQSSFIDFDRDGLMDILGADTSYANGQQSFKYNADGSYTAFQVGAYGVSGQTNDPNGNVYGWYGGAMGIDINGDGYVDMVYGDETPNDSEGRGGYDSGFVLNTDGTVMGFDKTGAYVYTNNSQDGVASTNGGNPTPDREVSGVDLNNDGYVDITYHATSGTSTTSAGGTSSSNSRLAIVTNGVDANGNMTLTNTQLITDVFNGDNASDNHYTTLTWSDLNGDGYMDLFVAGLTAKGGATSAIFYNDGTGKLTAAANGAGVGSNVQTLGDSVNSMSSLAVDWNGDGRMDLIEIAGAAGSTIATNTSNVGLLWTNNGVNGSNQVDWSSQTLLTGANQGSTNITTGALTLDLDYDGDKDLVVFRAAGGKTEYIENTSTISNGTSMILRIADANGINAFYGNTVLLVDESTGKVVSSQVINPQGGVNMNDSSGLVYFYGLDASKSYSAVLLANGQDYGGVSSATFDASGVVNTVENVNASWGGLTAVEKNHAYVLTAEDGASATNSALAATDGSNTVGIVGTGYNDTLNATAGTHIYNGGGGSRVVSDVDVWTAQGGMDVVDYTLAGSAALNIDLSNGAMQNTGFGQAQFVNIEGIAGGNGDDVFTGSTGENVFNGRGGNDTFNIGNGGHDTLLYKLINASDATGGNGSDVVNGFTVGTWEGTADTDRIDLRELLSGSGYTGSGSATYVNSVATLDAQAGNIEDYVRVVQNGSNTEIHVDLDGAGGVSASTTVVTLNGVQTDLATLLANHQLVIM